MLSSNCKSDSGIFWKELGIMNGENLGYNIHLTLLLDTLEFRYFVPVFLLLVLSEQFLTTRMKYSNYEEV